MRFFSCIVAAILTACSASKVSPVASLEGQLALARSAIEAGNAQKAGEAYGKIGTNSPEFPERLTDTMRWHFQRQDFQEIWRITELARRIDLDIPMLDYYRALAATRHGTCALGLPVQDELKRLLLAAHMYRFYNRYFGGGYNASPYAAADSGIQQNHLIAQQTHFLQDIGRATLLKRKGCRFFTSRFSSRKIASGWEYSSLKLFHEQHAALPAGEQTYIDDVEVRIIELAEENDDSETAERLLERYKNYDATAWSKLENERRQFLWRQLIEYEILPQPPYGKDSPHFSVVTGIIINRPPDEGLGWLGLINWYDTSREERVRLVNHLLEAKDQRYHPFLLTGKTELLYEDGQMLEALNYVRRLLLLSESGGDPEVERRVAYIASAIFAEYSYSEKVLGALQNAVPAGRWSDIFRSLLLRHAIHGNRRGFDLIVNVMSDAGKTGQLQLDKEQLALVRALAERDFVSFRRVIGKWDESRRAKGSALKILTDLAGGLVSLSDSEFYKLKDFTNTVTVFLKRYLMQGDQQVRIQGVLLVYGRERASEWARGGVSVGATAVAAGSVDLREDRLLVPPFTWNPPSRLPLADLVYVPDGIGSRGWILR